MECYTTCICIFSGRSDSTSCYIRNYLRCSRNLVLCKRDNKRLCLCVCAPMYENESKQRNVQTQHINQSRQLEYNNIETAGNHMYVSTHPALEKPVTCIYM